MTASNALYYPSKPYQNQLDAKATYLEFPVTSWKHITFDLLL